MEKVYLALETVGLTAEKTKLENDCREGASELKTTDVCVSFKCLCTGLGVISPHVAGVSILSFLLSSCSVSLVCVHVLL